MSAPAKVNVAMMTSGGLAPCLSSSIAQLVHYWVKALREGKVSVVTFRMYIDGYKGVLTGDSFLLGEETWDKCDALNYLGGSPIGNSRVKVSDVMRRFAMTLLSSCRRRHCAHLHSPLTNILITGVTVVDKRQGLFGPWIHQGG